MKFEFYYEFEFHRINYNTTRKCGRINVTKKPKLKYHFHNANTPEKMVDYILKVFIETNTKKVENAIKNTSVSDEKND